MEISLAGKLALVTGAGPNIGSGIALALARYGAKVACNDIDTGAAKACVRVSSATKALRWRSAGTSAMKTMSRVDLGRPWTAGAGLTS